MAKYYQYTIGCDPELFVVNPHGDFVSAHDLIPGTKAAPWRTTSGLGAMQVDGVAAEFNIKPAATADQFQLYIRDTIKEIRDLIKESHPGLDLHAVPTAMFDGKYFKKLPTDVRALGCSPDYNVYTGEANPMPKTKLPMRTAGGHVQVGWTEGQDKKDGAHLYDCHRMVEQLDCVLYPMSLLWDDDHRRRSLYGRIGTFRPTTFGVEYRPLSNVWVSDPDLQKWVFNATVKAANLVDDEVEMLTDPNMASMITDLFSGAVPERQRLLEYHEYITYEYDIPSLPEGYLEAA